MGKDLKGKSLGVGISQRKDAFIVLLGHSNVSITMNLYVHLTDDERAIELEEWRKP